MELSIRVRFPVVAPKLRYSYPVPDSQKKFEITPAAAILLAGVVVALAILYVNASSSETIADNLPREVFITPPSAQDYRYGSDDAPIVLVEYSDFECPYCQMVNATLKRLVDESDGGVAWVYRHLPLDIHPQAQPAAVAAECVGELLGQSSFWAFAGALFADQQGLGAALYTDTAVSLGADRGAFGACLVSGKYDEKIAGQGAEAFGSGATGTPFTVVYSSKTQAPLSGALPYEQFKAVIQAVNTRL